MVPLVPSGLSVGSLWSPSLAGCGPDKVGLFWRLCIHSMDGNWLAVGPLVDIIIGNFGCDEVFIWEDSRPGLFFSYFDCSQIGDETSVFVAGVATNLFLI
jgi:hypothetical protein